MDRETPVKAFGKEDHNKMSPQQRERQQGQLLGQHGPNIPVVRTTAEWEVAPQDGSLIGIDPPDQLGYVTYSSHTQKDTSSQLKAGRETRSRH